MKTILLRLIATLLRNILFTELILLIPIAFFTWRIELYFSETIGMLYFLSGVLFALIAVMSFVGGSSTISFRVVNFFDSMQIAGLDSLAQGQNYQQGMFLKGSKLWPATMLFTAVINLALGAWLWNHHFPLF